MITFNRRHLLRITVFLLAIAFVLYSLATRDGIADLLLVKIPYWAIAVLVVGSLSNWLGEALKWHMLTRGYRQGFRKTFNQTIQGAATAFFTPNRSGEFIGKVAGAPPEYRVAMVSLSIAGSLIQLSTTVVFGLLALIYLRPGWLSDVTLNDVALTGSMILVTCILLFYLVTRFRKNFVTTIIAKLQEGRQALKVLTSQQITAVISLSVGRYLIFSSQFVFIILMLGAAMPVADVYFMVMIFYLLSSFVPSSILGEVGVRESVAIFIFSPAFLMPAAAVQASLIMWCVNIVLPATAGSFLLLKKQHKPILQS